MSTLTNSDRRLCHGSVARGVKISNVCGSLGPSSTLADGLAGQPRRARSREFERLRQNLRWVSVGRRHWLFSSRRSSRRETDRKCVAGPLTAPQSRGWWRTQKGADFPLPLLSTPVCGESPIRVENQVIRHTRILLAGINVVRRFTRAEERSRRSHRR